MGDETATGMIERYLPEGQAVGHRLRDVPGLIKLAWDIALIYPEAGDEIIGDLLADVRAITSREAERLEADALPAAEARAAEFWTDRLRRIEATARQRTADLAAISLESGLNPHSYYVYLLWSAKDADKPIYVGRSFNVLSRLGDHMTGPPRFETHWVTIIDCVTEYGMIDTEGRLIAYYKPRLNINGAGG